MSLDIQVVGTNHKHTPLAGRERLTPSGESARDLLERARAALGARECVMLRTCNRVEIYFVASAERPGERGAQELFREVCGPSAKVSSDSIYHYCGGEATRHLFEVACGLDSMILGEHEVLGQVKVALSEARESGHAGPVMTRLFSHAIRVGKRARRETAISSGIFSVGQCAARLARQVLGELRGKHLLVFGAGRIAKVTAKHMAALGVGPITVFSRTRERAQDLATMLEGRAITADELPQALLASDILVGCASAPHHVVDAADIQQATRDRDGRPLVVVDLGVPRNVDPEVGGIQGVHLFNIDDLSAVVAENAGAREAEMQRARAIVEEEVADSQRLQAQGEATAAISKLLATAEQLRQQCLKEAGRKQLSEQDFQHFDYLTDLLVRRLLHKPMVALRESACGQQANDTDLVAAVAKLFELDGSDDSECRAEPGRQQKTSGRAT